MAHRRIHGGRMAVRWQGEAVMRRCSAVPSSYIAVADRGGVPGSGEVRFCSGFLLLLAPAAASFSAPLLPLSSLGLVCWCEPHGRGKVNGGLGLGVLLL